jgi:hypothetical protein
MWLLAALVLFASPYEAEPVSYDYETTPCYVNRECGVGECWVGICEKGFCVAYFSCV